MTSNSNVNPQALKTKPLDSQFFAIFKQLTDRPISSSLPSTTSSTMPDDLRIQLGKSRHEAEARPQQRISPWPQHVWAAARAAYISGRRPPERRFPVIMSEDSPASTPEKLQELIDLGEAPRMISTSKTTLHRTEDEHNGEAVQICDIGDAQLTLLEKRAEVKQYDIVVWFHGKKRGAVVIVSLKEEREESPIASKTTDGIPPPPLRRGQDGDSKIGEERGQELVGDVQAETGGGM